MTDFQNTFTKRLIGKMLIKPHQRSATTHFKTLLKFVSYLALHSVEGLVLRQLVISIEIRHLN